MKFTRNKGFVLIYDIAGIRHLQLNFFNVKYILHH